VIILSRTIELSQAPNPYWLASTSIKEYPELNRDVKVDVAVIGGGIAGITAAFLLTRKGLKVAVIEAGRILQGTTGHTTAKITSQHRLIYAKLKKEMGNTLASQYAEANEKAIHFIADTVNKLKIDCDFEWRPSFVFAQTDKGVKDIEDEVEAASSLGINASLVDKVPLPFPVKAAMRFDNQAQFHPLKYLSRLAQEITRKGSNIYEQTEAIDIEDEGYPSVITRKGKRVNASKVIVASHYPFFDGGGLFFTRLSVERSYIVAVKIKEDFPAGMFISAEDPVRSLRSQPDKEGELVLVAGEHHKTGHGSDLNTHYQNLIDYAADIFTLQDVAYRWSTQDCTSIDGVPYIGNLTRKSPNLYLATGFNKWGMTNGTVAGIILNDLITKGDNPWAPVYNPSRFHLASSLKQFATLNVDVVKHYVTGKVKGLPEHLNIKAGEAQVVEIDGNRIGAYRDEQGELHLMDITCTHLGCELNWNNAEKSWDCPCHGSRFTYQGDIIEGPAINCLNKLQEGANRVEAKIFD
jgi:glycine/D-amino acid oxidase-like deaminating enzyme/nitrite reductase/ring-hydroxylating ferredoxin subunit